MNKQRIVHRLGFAAVGATLTALAVWWWRRSSGAKTPHRAAVEALQDKGLPTTAPSTAFEPTPLRDRELSARPRARVQRGLSGDDYEAIGVDDLGAAFLARATDGVSSGDDDGDDAEIVADNSGFRIITPRKSAGRGRG